VTNADCDENEECQDNLCVKVPVTVPLPEEKPPIVGAAFAIQRASWMWLIVGMLVISASVLYLILHHKHKEPHFGPTPTERRAGESYRHLGKIEHELSQVHRHPGTEQMRKGIRIHIRKFKHKLK
jgi:hypothetical protein